MKCAKPQEWNSGAAIIVFSRALSGITDEQRRDRVEFFGCEREAPFGVPVVPEVRIVARPGASGGRRRRGRRARSATRASDLGCPASVSCQAM